MITNNDIMKKLRVALRLRDTDIMAILKLADFEVSAAELSAIFRREDHPNYMPCGDQLMRRFLDGLIIQNRGKKEPEEQSSPVLSTRPGPKPRKLVTKRSSVHLQRRGPRDDYRTERGDGGKGPRAGA